MTNGTEDTPTTDELAKELAATEGTDSPETAPDPAAADTAQPEAPAAQADPPAPDPEPDPPAGDAEPDKTIAPPVKTQAPDTSQADKKAADTTRRKATIAAAPDLKPLPGEEEEEKRKAGIYDELETCQAELNEALAAVESCKGRARDLMAELYPHTGESDKLVDAVRGHIKAQKRIRLNRASSPARIAEILKAAGRSPIDQAFHVQRARGMGRPTRSQAKPATDAGKTGGGSDANAGSE